MSVPITFSKQMFDEMLYSLLSEKKTYTLCVVVAEALVTAITYIKIKRRLASATMYKYMCVCAVVVGNDTQFMMLLAPDNCNCGN